MSAAVVDGVLPVGGRRALSVHALVVGVGWFALALPSMLWVFGGGGDEVLRAAPAPLAGLALVTIAAVALPLAWPVFLAVGWYEAGLAPRVGAGDERAVRAARRLLAAQAVACVVVALLAVAALVLTWAGSPSGERWGLASYVALAWLPFAVAAGYHLRTARRVAA